MTFEAILDQVIELLQRQGRVSYGAIKRRFDLDDDYLEDIKIELVDAQRLAVDENDKVLVWKSSVESYTPTAERRHLTVMFCDLVGSTELSRQLDPEALREVVRAYQETCVDIINRFEGYVARYMGNGLLVYFGYPQACEDAAQRSVYTGLDILGALPALNTHLHQVIPNLPVQALQVRIGIHTGLVVIEEVGEGLSREHQALGETPNLAARLERRAQTNTVWISADTYRLVQGYVVCHDVGFQTLKGFAEPIKAYQVHRKTDSQSRLDAVAEHRLTPLVGRSDEVALLLERWALAKKGMGQVVLLNGEAGLGKSRLVHVVKNQVAHEGYPLLECRSSPYYQYTALYPFIGMIQHGLQWQQDMTHEAQLETLEHALRQYHLPLQEAAPLLAPILALSIPEERYPPLNISPQRQRQKMFDILVAIVAALTAQQPVLLILEDLHWVDPSTLELLDRLIDQTPALALFTMLTCRPEFQPRWSHQAHLMYITLNGLPHTHVKAMVELVAGGKTLPPKIIRKLIEKTDGVPLFVEEMTKLKSDG